MTRQEYTKSIQVDAVEFRTCTACKKTKHNSEFISKKTCKLCNYKAQRRYLQKVGTARGKFWQLASGAKNRNIPFNLTESEFVNWWDNQSRDCFYCKRTEEEIRVSNDKLDRRTHKMSVDRMDSDGAYDIKNIVIACPRCNTTKGHFFTKDEMLQIGNIIKRKFDVQKDINSIPNSM